MKTKLKSIKNLKHQKNQSRTLMNASLRLQKNAERLSGTVIKNADYMILENFNRLIMDQKLKDEKECSTNDYKFQECGI